MLIKSIELSNFRIFPGKQCIDFSTEDNRNVTIIMGDNGSGKTTLAQAFSWCLYGTTTFKKNDDLLSFSVRDELPLGATAQVKVCLTLIHGETEYKISRFQDYRKDSPGRVKADSPVLHISYKAKDGQAEYIEDENQKRDLINEIIPNSISSYFFFDGERVEKMGNEIQNGRSKEFKIAVDNLLGLSAISEAIRHLKGGSNMVIQSYTRDYNDKADEDYQKAERSIQTFDERAAKLEKDIEDTKAALEDTQIKCAEYQTKLERSKDTKAWAQERKSSQDSVDRLEKSKEDAVKSMLTKFGESSWSFFATPMLKWTLKAVAESSIDLSKEAPTGINADTIKELIENKMCLCGTPIEFNTPEYKALESWIQIVPPEHIGASVRNFREQCETLLEQPSASLGQDIRYFLTQIHESDDSIFTMQSRIDELDELLAGAKDTSDIEEMYQAARRHAGDLTDKLAKYSQQLGMAKTNLAEAKRVRDTLVTNDTTNQRVRRDKEYAEAILEALSREHAQKESETREDLEKEINAIFKEFFDGSLKLELDDKYNVIVRNQESNFDAYDVETSEGQTVAVIFAFIAGVIRLATDQKRSDDEMLITEAYPLVMDAPMSKLDKKRIESVCTVVPRIAEQAVIMIKDTDGDLALEHLKSRIGYGYEIASVEAGRVSEIKKVEDYV